MPDETAWVYLDVLERPRRGDEKTVYGLKFTGSTMVTAQFSGATSFVSVQAVKEKLGLDEATVTQMCENVQTSADDYALVKEGGAGKRGFWSFSYFNDPQIFQAAYEKYATNMGFSYQPPGTSTSCGFLEGLVERRERRERPQKGIRGRVLTHLNNLGDLIDEVVEHHTRRRRGGKNTCLRSGDVDLKANGNALVGVGIATFTQVCAMLFAQDFEGLARAFNETLAAIVATPIDVTTGLASRCVELERQEAEQGIVHDAAGSDSAGGSANDERMERMEVMMILLFVTTIVAASLSAYVAHRSKAGDDDDDALLPTNAMHSAESSSSLPVVDVRAASDLAAADTDGDGLLSLEEAKAQGMSAATFNRIDADHDGAINLVELQAEEDKEEVDPLDLANGVLFLESPPHGRSTRSQSMVI